MKLHPSIAPATKFLLLMFGDTIDFRWIEKKHIKEEIRRAKTEKYIIKIIKVEPDQFVYNETMQPERYIQWTFSKRKYIQH